MQIRNKILTIICNRKRMVKPNEVEGVAVPESTIELLNRTLYDIEQLEPQLPQFLSLSDPDYLSQLPLLRRAHSLISLAKLTSTLFSCSYLQLYYHYHHHHHLFVLALLQFDLDFSLQWSWSVEELTQMTTLSNLSL